MKRPARTKAPADRATTSPSRFPSRAELQEQISELVAQQAAISEVLRAIASSPGDLQPIFATILDGATRLCQADGGTLRLIEVEGVRLVAQKLSPALERWYTPPKVAPHDSYVGRNVASRSPIHIPDLSASDFYRRGDPTVVALVKAGMRSTVFVPMLRNDDVIGALAIWRERLESFGDKQIELVADFAAQAAIALEITRRERQLREVQMELAHANRLAATGQLTACIAHDVKQPITAAVASAQAALHFLRHEPPELGKVRQVLDAIVESGHRAGDVIDGIRALVKKAPLRKERLDIRATIHAVIELTHSEAVKNCVSVQTDLAQDLPLIEGDRVQLQQVMLNLIVNGIEAMSDVGDGQRDLLINAEATQDGVRVAVQDSGAGQCQEKLDRLFEPFYTTKPDGMGMGLSICRSIVETHGGRLWATSCEPRGALFQFEIPARQRAAP